MKNIKKILFFFLFLNSIQLFSQTSYKKNDKVEIDYNGTWYPGYIMETKADQYKVHYDDYGADWDSWLPASKLRSVPSAVKDNAGAKAPKPVGQKTLSDHKVTKQEKFHDKTLPNLGDGVTYLFTYTDNTTFQLWQSNNDQNWYGADENNELVGPLTIEQGLEWGSQINQAKKNNPSGGNGVSVASSSGSSNSSVAPVNSSNKAESAFYTDKGRTKLSSANANKDSVYDKNDLLVRTTITDDFFKYDRIEFDVQCYAYYILSQPPYHEINPAWHPNSNYGFLAYSPTSLKNELAGKTEWSAWLFHCNPNKDPKYDFCEGDFHTSTGFYSNGYLQDPEKIKKKPRKDLLKIVFTVMGQMITGTKQEWWESDGAWHTINIYSAGTKLQEIELELK